MILKCASDDILPGWTSKRHEILDIAMSAVALAVFSRIHKYPPAAVEASASYHQLLRVTQVAVCSMDANTIDACLAAIFLMGRYENIVHDPFKQPRSTGPFLKSHQSFSHHDGASALLKVWKEQMSTCHPATETVKHIRRGVLKSSLLRNVLIPHWMEDGSSFGESGLELEYDRFIVQVAVLRQRLSALLKKTAINDAEPSSDIELVPLVKTLSDEAQDLEQVMRIWETNLPATWSYQKIFLPEVPSKNFYSSTVYVYSSSFHALVRVQYYSMRLLVNNICMRAEQLLSRECRETQYLEYSSVLKTVADHLAASLPSCLRRFQVTNDTESKSSDQQLQIILNKEENLKPWMAELAVWPLTVASSSRDLDTEQRLWFRQQLSDCGRSIGDGVLEFEKADRWLSL